MSRFIGVIPARWASTRLPGKVLAPIRGIPMVEWVWSRAKKCKSLDQVWVATDSKEVFDLLKQKNIPVLMTSEAHPSGTDRLAEVVKQLKLQEVDWALNLQGDEPLLQPEHLEPLISQLKSPHVSFGTQLGSAPKSSSEEFFAGTLITQITEEGYLDPNTVKALVDDQKGALYFTRALAPFTRQKFAEGIVFKHIGVYAYQVGFLSQFASWPKHPLEEAESLEQLRILGRGFRMKCVFVDQPVYEFQGSRQKFSTSVDTPEDLERVRAIAERHDLWP